MAAPGEVIQLIERFERNRAAYLSGQYNETQVRREFLDPFFSALGWDVDNKQGYAEAYKDVIHEDAIKVGGATKAPDYCFRIGGTKKFFVEAKKPSVNLKDDISPAFQLRRYAWSAKLPLSILTDFEELAVYDCRIKPVKTDRASTARTLYVTYKDYAERWDEIESIFAREEVLKGSFDKYAATGKHKKGTAAVDDAFLKEIESWRDLLARNFALRNPGLSQRELNFAVQRTIDRIIFLRISEDRGIEEYGRLMALLNGTNVYKRLFHIFRNADERYNSGLFHFEREKGRQESPDDLTPSLEIDDKIIKEITKRLYYPESPYEFSVLPADILGQVYEQFLGRVIRLTAGHRAVVEEKPEVRKAGGVYYTPTYIVDYIVKNTVGELITGNSAPTRMTPKEVSKIRILDPACGSGSFLLGAFQYLLDWHRDWYVKNDPGKWATGKNPAIFQALSPHPSAPNWRLTTAEKKRILLNNIYGVDIDSQAVEVTKLSLLLKVLEGENDQTIERQLRFFHERALPDLGDNIKCGNSLIGPDFYDTDSYQNTPLPFDSEETLRINAFDWSKEFAEVMKAGGFDVIIGNPPYGANIDNSETYYLQNRFKTTDNSPDTYSLFIEQSLVLCKPNGKVSMIVPTGWYSGAKYSALRRFVACSSDPEIFVNLPYDIFKAWVDTTVFVLARRASPTSWPRKLPHSVNLCTFSKRHKITSLEEFEEDIRSADFADWFKADSDEYLTYADSATTSLIHKIDDCSRPLKKFADVQRGVTPFKLTEQPACSVSRIAFNGTVRRYSIENGSLRYICFDETLAEPKPERYFKGPRLLLRELISRQFRLQLVQVSDDFVTNKSMQSILKSSGPHDLNYLLGLLNSRLMSWYFLNRSQMAQRDDFPKIVLKESRSLPIRPINFSDSSDAARHEKIGTLAEQMLSLYKQASSAKTDHEKTALQRQIDATDKRIDELVYELYGLTEEEIRIIEERQ